MVTKVDELIFIMQPLSTLNSIGIIFYIYLYIYIYYEYDILVNEGTGI